LTTNHYSDGIAHTYREPVIHPLQSPALFGKMWELQNYHPLNQESKHSFKYVEIRDGKKPLGRPRRKLEDNIKVDLQDWKIILKWIFWKWDVGAWTGSSWSRLGAGVGLL